MVKFKLFQSSIQSQKLLEEAANSHLKECAAQRRMAPMNTEKDAQSLSDRLTLFAILALFLLVQSVLSVAGYSGYQKPPLYGDFEAQRHWMEITVHLPPKEWYVNSTANDLNYWGLDYPPLTAYHSWLLGQIANLLNARWVRLHESRGLEESVHKLFMRLSVIVTMLALYAPALIHLLLVNQQPKEKASKSEKAMRVFGAALMYPGLLFIDCAHFQYNHISLALFLWTIACLEGGRFALGSALFVLALNHKQMELYHALPIAVFLLARSIRRTEPALLISVGKSLWNLSKLAAVVFGIFSLLWLPFVWPDSSIALQVLRRVFPFDRGLFEDKVANFWCCASVLVKFKHIYSTPTLIKASALLVFFACLPSLLCLFYRPNKANFRLALACNALAFFLFSFQVHEKSILLAAIPSLLLLPDENIQRSVGVFLTVSAFSLYPLCLKDGVGNALFFFMAYPFLLKLANPQQQQKLFSRDTLVELNNGTSASLCFLALFASPPARLPHLFPLLIALHSFSVFFLFWAHLNGYIVARNWAVFLEHRRKDAKKKKLL